MQRDMIPKKIHYCWFGGKPLPPKAIKCIASWKKYCPDYEIVEWNEHNYDVHQNAYTRYVYESKKFAFLSDFARLQIIEEEGGIYFDVDVEVIRSFDDLLIYNGFFGFETKQFVNTGLGFGAKKNNELIQDMIKEYDPLLDGQQGTAMCPCLNTRALTKHGLQLDGEKQLIEGVIILPVEYLNPYDDPTGRLNITKNTYSIHWFAKSWMNKKDVLRSKLTKPIHRLLGTEVFHKK